jgi:hypothetical protein
MPVIAIDFDGTIVEDLYPNIGKARPGAIEAINTLCDHGYCIIINSCRSREKQDEMRVWLDQNKVRYCHINENCRERIVKYRTDCRKISADCYIDDKNLIPVDGLKFSWPVVVRMLVDRFGYHGVRECEL